MAYFVIVGQTNCKNSAHAFYVAAFLSKHLRNFKYRSKTKSEEEWPSWLDETNSVNNWHQTKSPVIWKEVSRMGGQKYLIGGLGEFWEYCYDYYGFESKLTRDDIAKIMTDDLQMAQHRTDLHVHRICILGALNHLMLQMTIYELQTCFHLKKNEQMEIRVFDRMLGQDPEEEAHVLDTIDELRNCVQWVPQSLQLVPSSEEALDNSDFLIVITNYSRSSGEDLDTWLGRCRQDMLHLAHDINAFAKRHIKVILSHPGPTCFTASVLLEYCTTIRLSNIVAVTADAGISVISMMAEKIDEPVKNFWCPPVWGFPGLMEYINLSETAIRTKVYRPFRRALFTKESTRLPKGVIQYEMRFFESYIKVDDLLYEEFDKRKAEGERMLQRQPFLSKVRALGSLLKLWCAEEISDDVISLGICSNGSFGFPVGICFSQAVSLNEKRIWEPAAYIHLTPATVAKIAAISLQVESTLKNFGLGMRQVTDDGHYSSYI